MKNRSLLLVSTIIASILFMFSACVEDTNEKPTISVSIESGATYKVGSTVKFQIKVSSNEKLQELVVTANPTGASGTSNSTIPSSDDYSTTFVYDYVIPSSLKSGDNVTISFKVVDKVETNEETKTFTVGSNDVQFGTSTNSGKIYNANNPSSDYPSGWDLVSNEDKNGKASPSEVDMFNLTAAQGKFSYKWYSKNSTLYVNTSLDFNTATVNQAETAYNNGSPGGSNSSSSFSVSNGAIIVAKIRGTNEYAIIKITNIVDDGNDTNNDYIEFSYKKGTITK